MIQSYPYHLKQNLQIYGMPDWSQYFVYANNYGLLKFWYELIINKYKSQNFTFFNITFKIYYNNI